MIGFPLLLIPLAIYNIIAFLMRDVSFAAPLFTVPLTSGTAWPVTLSDAMLTLGILLLLCEVIKGARPGAKYLTDHLLSLLVVCAAAAEFVLLPQFGTSTFFLLALLALVDFLGGIALRARRGTHAAAVASRRAARAPEPTPEPRYDPAPAPAPRLDPAPAPTPAPAPPPAAPVAETVRPNQPEPAPAHPAIAPNPPSPEIPSPGLQPGHGTAPPSDTPPR